MLEQRKATEAAAAAGLVKERMKTQTQKKYQPERSMLFGRPLKLYDKDIDPAERDKIMAEMFRRVRPHLERNKEMAKVRERENAEWLRLNKKGTDPFERT